jgi:hypothetical protein
VAWQEINDWLQVAFYFETIHARKTNQAEAKGMGTAES